ncbi:MAG: HD domain-containing protein [Magnetococcales bacterium]|nr:HD domain-containing protein [Magnetococcales bacterium]
MSTSHHIHLIQLNNHEFLINKHIIEAAKLFLGTNFSSHFHIHENIDALCSLSQKTPLDLLVISHVQLGNLEGKQDCCAQDLLDTLKSVNNVPKKGSYTPCKTALLLLSNKYLHRVLPHKFPDLILGVLPTPIENAQSVIPFFHGLLHRLSTHRLLTEKIADTTKALMNGLAQAIEKRDGFTGGHVNRVGTISRRLAELYFRKQEIQPLFDLDHFEWAAVLHDVGKISTPECILIKPGRFEGDERSIMERHAIVGSTLLEDANADNKLDLLSIAATIAKTHHEKCDGTGYPNGISKNEIPLEGRIVAVADVMDALLSKRSYKEAKTPEVTLKILIDDRFNENGSGHFDEDIIDILVNNWDDLLKLWNECKIEDVDQGASSPGHYDKYCRSANTIS